ncbi:MAG TPA: hypothetical protein VG944_11375 [Fimbriimonas sp.]|nr:hypothetical protein [Fimbriimonas sp.]
MKPRLLLLLLVGLLLFGCGGGGGAQKPATSAIPSMAVNWPLRTRNLTGPSSALSVSILLHSTGVETPDVNIIGDRSSNLAAHAETYASPAKTPFGPYTLTVTFYSSADLGGFVVGTASANVIFQESHTFTDTNGFPLGDIAFTGVVTSVKVVANQSTHVSQTVQVTANALDAQNNIMVVSPGSFSFAVASGGSNLTLTPDGSATGLQVGAAMLTASVDGVTSPPTAFEVVAQTDFANPGFETPQLNANTWEGDGPTGFIWTGDFTQGVNTWGVANGSGSWGTAAHSGNQYAFIQCGASMSQTLTGLVPGESYHITFWMARRNGNVGGNAGVPLTVTVDGNTVFGPTAPPDDGNWWIQQTSSFTPDTDTATIVFSTPSQADSSDLLDDVHLVVDTH